MAHDTYKKLKKLAGEKPSSNKKIRRRTKVMYVEGSLAGVDLSVVKNMYALGHTDEEVAFAISVTPTTIMKMSVNYPEVAEARKAGKDIADRRVEQALFKRAIGYDILEITKEPCYFVDKDNNKKTVLKQDLIVTKTVTKHFPPEVNACSMWLRNRKSLEWQDTRPTITVEQKNQTLVVHNNVKPEEITDDHKRRVENNIRILRKYGIINPESVEASS